MIESNLLFLHVPKVAGSSMNATPLAKSVKFKIHSFKGDIFEKIGELGCRDFFKYGFVRNPYSRFNSLYNYFRNMSEQHVFYKFNVAIIRVVREYEDINDFCANFNKLQLRNNFHFRPQIAYFKSVCPDYQVDFIGKYENLQKDFDMLCDTVGVGRCVLPIANSSGVSNKMLVNYSRESENIIREFYQEDFSYFGYEEELC
jgi:hypothetical protein